MSVDLSDDRDDGFGPTGTRMVECCHCGAVFPENEARFEHRPQFSVMVDKLYGKPTKLWWCKTSDCDGAGVGFDLHYTRKRKTREPFVPDTTA